jgi:hypothetical protein
MVADPAELESPLTQLCYSGAWGEKLVHRAYVFDQEMARLGIKYHAVVGVVFRRRVLLVTIPKSEASRVAECIARLERR